MSNHSQVVVAYDFSKSSCEAMDRAIALATRAPFHVLHFVCVIEPHAPLIQIGPGPVDYLYAERVQKAIAETLALELKAAKVADKIHFFVHARIGKPAEEILSLAREIGADLILIGTRGRTGIEHALLGSVAERVMREAGCTVEVVRAKTYEHVELLDLKETAPHSHFVPPHRYSYEDNRLTVRPTHWPLY